MTDFNKLSLKILLKVLYKKMHITLGAGLPNESFQVLSFFPRYINKT